MKTASELPRRYNIGKTNFYQRRDLLIQLGYDMQPEKQGRKCFYSEQQIQLFDELDDYISENHTTEGFPPAQIPINNNGHHSPTQPSENQQFSFVGNSNGDINSSVQSNPESKISLVQTNQLNIDRPEPSNSNNEEESVVLDLDPLADIKEQKFKSVDVAAQFAAAGNLAAFNYLQIDYMKHRDFSVKGLAEEVQQSEQAVRQTFANMMTTPKQMGKKIMDKMRERRQHNK